VPGPPRQLHYREERLARFRRCCRFRSFHLAFWLLLSFARAALVHLNAIGRSVAAVSERPDPPDCEAQGGPGRVICADAYDADDLTGSMEYEAVVVYGTSQHERRCSVSARLAGEKLDCVGATLARIAARTPANPQRRTEQYGNDLAVAR
jgi:hypothetical protein